jgi:DNA-binding HxlR family transcriptional regulator
VGVSHEQRRMLRQDPLPLCSLRSKATSPFQGEVESCDRPAVRGKGSIALPERAERGSYGQFCPVSMAAEIVCNRWTALILRELLAGSTRFNDLRRGVPRMSPTLLSKRLKELEDAGVIIAEPTQHHGVMDYRLTQAGEDLRGVIDSLGFWGQRWIESSLSLQKLDPGLLLWDVRRNVRVGALPRRRCTIKFIFPELAADRRSWWLVVDGDKVDLCLTDPGYDVDLYVRGPLREMTAIWMGMTRLDDEIAAGNVQLDGDKAIANSIHAWLGLSSFAKGERAVG